MIQTYEVIDYISGVSHLFKTSSGNVTPFAFDETDPPLCLCVEVDPGVRVYCGIVPVTLILTVRSDNPGQAEEELRRLMHLLEGQQPQFSEGSVLYTEVLRGPTFDGRDPSNLMYFKGWLRMTVASTDVGTLKPRS